jgi:hypothetical protein
VGGEVEPIVVLLIQELELVEQEVIVLHFQAELK